MGIWLRTAAIRRYERTMELTRFEWPDHWSPLTTGTREVFEAELIKEVGPGHKLLGQQATAIARRLDQDDVLFVLADNRVAEVHLTWGYRTESDPRWPRTTVYSSLGEWAAEKVRSAIE